MFPAALSNITTEFGVISEKSAQLRQPQAVMTKCLIVMVDGTRTSKSPKYSIQKLVGQS